jgi:alkylation response protein AidB-like acyl-CoA dehydrogenase
VRVDSDRDGTLAELNETVKAVCASLGGIACARRAITSATPGFDPTAWKILSDQVGIAALGLPEPRGGIGGLPELLTVSESLGASLFPVPFFSSTVLAGQILARCEATTRFVLEAMACGETAAAAAFGNDGRWDPTHPLFTLDKDGRVSGHAPTVLGAPQARWLIAATAHELVLTDLRSPGCKVARLPTLDLTRSAGAVILDAAACAVVSDRPGRVLSNAVDVAALVLAAEPLGGAKACLDMTVAYVKERHQFSRQIGSFQAVKHTLADALVRLEMARSALSWALENSCVAEELGKATAVARIWCNEAYRFVSAEAIQLHGGIGFTWEHNAHLYYRRAHSDALILGNSAMWRERLAVALGW